MIPYIIECLLVGKIKSFGKFTYQCNDIFEYVLDIVIHESLLIRSKLNIFPDNSKNRVELSEYVESTDKCKISQFV